jgi:SAM-dependent methyltransferase
MSASSTSYAHVIAQLRPAYNRSAADRDVGEKSEWKLAERRRFLQRLQGEDKTRLLEIGAGTGQDSLFFQEHGLRVVATDLAPEMVARCRAKGLEAYVMEFLNLGFPSGSFDSGYAFNCLLHVPNADLPAVLTGIRSVLAPSALLYMGMYGGEEFEGILPDDWHSPPRFFSFRSDEQLLQLISPYFELVDFHVVSEERVYFQALTLRVPRSLNP